MTRFFQIGIWRPSPRWLGIWFVAELLAFLLVVDEFGWGVAILAQIASMAVGILLLRRLGRDLAGALSPAPSNEGASFDRLADGAMTGLAAALLIVPGFLSSLAALALAAPPMRRWLRRRLATFVATTGGCASRGARTVDLDLADWRHAPGPVSDEMPRLR